MELDEAFTIGKIKTLLGKQVLDQLSDVEFSKEWDGLFASCPWASVFQSRPYVTSWYETYHSQHLPVLLKFEQNGKLLGLLPLTRIQGSSIITGAGAEFAEYHAWLAESSVGKKFIELALHEIKVWFPGCKFQLKYLPPQAPINWIKGLNGVGHLQLEPHERPYINLADSNPQKHLQKKELRNKLNRLRRLGDVQFEQINGLSQFVTVFEAIKCQFEFRKAVKYNFYPFEKDPSKKEFFMRLFKNNLLDVSVLKLNDEIIASIIATKGREILHFAGMITYHPFYSKYSPGILNILLLNQSILKKGTTVFDLSPGGDRFKVRLSNSSDKVYTLTQNSYGAGVFESGICFLKSNLRYTLNYLGFSAQKIRRYVSTGMNRADYIRNHGRIPIWGKPGSQQVVFKLDFDRNFSGEAADLKKNQLCDLLKYDQRNSSGTRWDFLQEAAQRLKSGEQVYSSAQCDLLNFCVWSLELEKHNPNFAQLPVGAVVLYGLYYHPEARQDVSRFIKAAYRAVSNSPDQEVYLIADASDAYLAGLFNEGVSQRILS